MREAMTAMKIKELIYKNKLLIKNFSYITAMQVFLLIAPLITYPYLVKVLGKELYGVVLTAQMLTSYATLFIDFGSNSVCAKHVSINRHNILKLSEIVSSVLCIRAFLCLICFCIYCGVVFLIPIYREYSLLFLLTYGMTLNDLLFPQYFFQGKEHMGVITIISIITKLIFILLVFLVVKTTSDYIMVPILNTIGYALGGIVALFIISRKEKIRFYVPKMSEMLVYVKDSSAIFTTDIICTVKDKLNYIFVGSFTGMSNVVVYDLCLKLNSLVAKPLNIMCVVLFPRFAKSHNVDKVKKVMLISLLISVLLVSTVNLFLPQIVDVFLHEEINLFPIRLFLLAPIMLSISSIISSNVFIAWGYNKYVFYSILVTTTAYLVSLIIFVFLNMHATIYTFIVVSLVSYFTELVYRLVKVRRVFAIEKKN